MGVVRILRNTHTHKCMTAAAAAAAAAAVAAAAAAVRRLFGRNSRN